MSYIHEYLPDVHTRPHFTQQPVIEPSQRREILKKSKKSIFPIFCRMVLRVSKGAQGHRTGWETCPKLMNTCQMSIPAPIIHSSQSLSHPNVEKSSKNRKNRFFIFKNLKNAFFPKFSTMFLRLTRIAQRHRMISETRLKTLVLGQEPFTLNHSSHPITKTRSNAF